MTHADALNMILANACPAQDHDDGSRTFVLELHCVIMEVRARLASTVGSIQYEVISVEIA